MDYGRDIADQVVVSQIISAMAIYDMDFINNINAGITHSSWTSLSKLYLQYFIPLSTTKTTLVPTTIGCNATNITPWSSSHPTTLLVFIMVIFDVAFVS